MICIVLAIHLMPKLQGYMLEKSFNKQDMTKLAEAFKAFLDKYFDREEEAQPKHTIQDILKAFDNHLFVNDRSLRYRNEIKRIATGLPDLPIESFTYDHFSQLVSDKSSITKNRYLSYLKILFNYAVDEGFIERNPLKKWKKSKESPRDSKLSLSDLQKIYVCASPHLKWAIDVQFNLGVRAGEKELCSLKWTDVDLENDRIRIYASKTRSHRYVAISKEFKARLLEKREESQGCEFIISYQGRPIKRFHKSFRTACKRAGIEYHAVMYDIRHLFATTLLIKGADLNAVSKMLGHSSVTMTANTYYHYLENEQRRAAEILNSTSLNQFLKDEPVSQPSGMNEKITKEELSRLVWEMSTEQIGKKYGVTGKAIEKWCKKWNIEKPGRGYWARKYAERED